MDVAYAAAVVGLESEAFLEKIRENVGLQNAGLLVLDSANGSMKRDAWTSSFPDIVFALDFPKLVDKPPVVPEPDRLPGAFVHIPDTNLRAVIARNTGQESQCPDYCAGDEKADKTRCESNDRGIKDLTGLQFATNLVELYLTYTGEGNQVNDLSPIAGLINLRVLFLHHNPISDISPVSRG